jgi:predicted  nucleic acid-binding Zn-ribbon protein
MASLEAEINQYTIEIKETTAKIDGLRRRLEDANDDKKERRLEQEIQALEGQRDKLVELRSKLQDKLPGAFGRHQHPH